MVLVATQVKRRRGTTAENDAFTGAEGEITVDTEKHELRVHDGVTQGGFKIGGGSGAMPVGAIFTTPRTGTIQGAVEANGSPYNIADYSGDGSIGALLTAGNIAYVSKAEFQTQVTNTGACDSFGWNGTSDPTFLVPKLNPWHVGKSAPVVGNGGAVGVQVANSQGVNQILATNIAGGDLASGVTYGAATTPVGITTDPTKSGMVADLSETTNLRVMVQLATGATDQALETCTSVLSDVSGLKDMSNVTATGKETVVSWGMPDYSAGVSVASAITDSNERTYTAPTDGVIVCYLAGFNGQDAYVKVNDITVERVVGYGANSWLTITGQYKVAKNDVVKFKSGYPNAGIIGDRFVTFYPLKGVNQ